jgi:cobalt-zinc-cadmium efflux system membrane fusion protein
MGGAVFRLRPAKRVLLIGIAALAAAAALVVIAYCALSPGKAAAAPANVNAGPGTPRPAADPTENVELTDAQSASIKVGPLGDRVFPVEKDAVGSIDFNEDMTVQVFTPYQGRIIDPYASLGDTVAKGQVLFTLESPDFIQAQSTLISAAGVLEQTNSALARAKKLYARQGIDQNDYETAVANQQTAEGALKAARNAVAVFGKTEAEIDRIVAARRVENALLVRSPISGRVTARNAAPGLLEQPGTPPAPYAVADLSTVWMLANVTEGESPAIRVGEEVTVTVVAYPGREFKGSVTAVGANIDPNTRRVTVRSAIQDPKHELRPGMFANFTIQTGNPITAPAAPLSAVVREGDGTMSVWVTSDRRHFHRRTVHLGLQRDDYDQILDGVQAGEEIAIDSAIFLSNMAAGGAS